MGASIRNATDEHRPLIGGGRYELLHELASGGMATVYLARARGASGFERIVAIKCCHKHLRQDEEFSAMFLDEARVVSELHHSNVVSTIDFGEDPEYSLFIAMEFVDGFSLQQVLRACKHKGVTMPATIALRVAVDTLHGLHAAHEHTDRNGAPLNIVHRDVSPQNVLVGIDGVTRIMDFGIARAEGRLAHTREGAIKGKLAYMPPEQHGLLSDKQHAVTARADVFAAAIVLWEALAGEKLFQKESDAQTLRAAMKCEVPKLAGRVEGVTAAVDDAIAKAIQREPSDRFESARAFVEALEASGLRAASTLEVSKWVRALLASHIEARQRLLRSFADSAAESNPVSLVREKTPSPAPQPTTLPAPALDPAASDALPPEAPRFRTSVAPPKSSSAPRARSVLWTVLFAILTVGVSALAATVVVRAHRAAPRIEAAADSALPAARSQSARSSRLPSLPTQVRALEAREVPTAQPSIAVEGVPDAGAQGRRRPPARRPSAPSTQAPHAFRPRFL